MSNHNGIDVNSSQPITHSDLRRVAEILIAKAIGAEDLLIIDKDDKKAQIIGFSIGKAALNLLTGVDLSFDMAVRFALKRETEEQGVLDEPDQ
jgi:hypothetical protein